MNRVCRQFSIWSETKRKRSKILFASSETEGFVSLWSETADFTCETKWKWSKTKQKSKTKRNRRSKAKKLSEKSEKNISKWNEGKTASRIKTLVFSVCCSIFLVKDGSKEYKKCWNFYYHADMFFLLAFHFSCINFNYEMAVSGPRSHQYEGSEVPTASSSTVFWHQPPRLIVHSPPRLINFTEGDVSRDFGYPYLSSVNILSKDAWKIGGNMLGYEFQFIFTICCCRCFVVQSDSTWELGVIQVFKWFKTKSVARQGTGFTFGSFFEYAFRTSMTLETFTMFLMSAMFLTSVNSHDFSLLIL